MASPAAVLSPAEQLDRFNDVQFAMAEAAERRAERAERNRARAAAEAEARGRAHEAEMAAIQLEIDRTAARRQAEEEEKEREEKAYELVRPPPPPALVGVRQRSLLILTAAALGSPRLPSVLFGNPSSTAARTWAARTPARPATAHAG